MCYLVTSANQKCIFASVEFFTVNEILRAKGFPLSPYEKHADEDFHIKSPSKMLATAEILLQPIFKGYNLK